jgi:hypothetical protein
MQNINRVLSVTTINANHLEVRINKDTSCFFSYEREICVIHKNVIYLNADYWTYSITTKKHLYKWLGLDRNEINHYLKNGKAFEYSEYNNANLPTLHELINLKSEAI